MTSRASAASSRSRTVGAAPKPAIPRYSAWSFEMMSPRRQPAMTGTWRSSAKRVSSVDVRARRTPAPARITGRRAEARNSMTARSSSSVARATGGLTASSRASSAIGSSSRSSASDRSTGPGRPPSAWRIASAIAPGTSSTAPGSAAHLARPPRVATWSISWNASRPRYARSTWPTIANIGVESCRAVWIPMARLAAPTARVPRHTAGRPVSCPWASAMNAAAPSWRVATTRMPAPSNASSRPRKDSPGTVKAYRTPADRRASATNRPTVRGPASMTGSRSAGATASAGRRRIGRRLRRATARRCRRLRRVVAAHGARRSRRRRRSSVAGASGHGSGGSGAAAGSDAGATASTSVVGSSARAASSSVMTTVLLRSVGPPAEGGQR